MAWLLRLRKACQTSLWLLPGLMGLGFIFLACALLYFDSHVEMTDTFTALDKLQANAFLQILTTMLGAIFTVFGILLPMTFSILMTTATEFSPMLLRIYRSVMVYKIFLGLIFGTTLYLITMLAGLYYLLFPLIPTLSFFVAFVLLVLTIVSIPVFFDKFASSLEPTYVVAMIARDLKDMLEKLEVKDSDISAGGLRGKQDRSMLKVERYEYRVRCTGNGYVQSIDYKHIVKILQRMDAIAALPVLIGDFLLEGGIFLYVSKKGVLADEMKQELNSCLAIGKKRMNISDLHLQLDELLSIVTRALSPGTTDLSTAYECINYVGFTCNLLINRELSQGVHCDNEGVPRLYTKEFDFFGFVRVAFDAIRQNALAQPSVVIQAIKTLRQLVENCRGHERAKILQEVAEEIYEQARHQHAKVDRDEMQHHLRQVELTIARLEGTHGFWG